MIRYIDNITSEYLKEFIDSLVPFSGPIYFDTETSGLDCRLDRILLAQFMVDGIIYVLNVPKLGTELLTKIAERIEDNLTKIVAHNAKFDWKFIFHYTGIKWTNTHDTMNCECVLNAGIGSSTYSLGELVEKYTGEVISKEVRDSFFNGSNSIDFTEQQIQYSAKDVKVLEPIYLAQIKRTSEAKEVKVMEVEMGIVPVVAEMEYDGVLVDKDAWIELEKAALLEAGKFEKEFKDKVLSRVDYEKYTNALQLADYFKIPVKTKRARLLLESITDTDAIKDVIIKGFNINSSQQVREVVNNLGLVTDSVSEKKLTKHRKKYDFIDTLLSYREHAKLSSTYGSNIFEFINPISGRMHVGFLNNGGATGRMSYKFHNIPRDIRYRNAFLIARPEHSIITADYSQAEYRLAGAISGEENIINAYIDGKDMHSATAAFRFKKNINDVTKAERSVGKSINFLMIYGGTAFGMSHKLEVPVKEAEAIVNDFYLGYPKLAKFKEMVENKIIELGYSITPLGRRRYMSPMPDMMDSKEYVYFINRQKRELFNHIIQGGSADSVKISMLEISRRNPFGDKFRLLLQEHDELVAEAHNSVAKDAEVFVVETMKECFQPFLGEIPALVDSHCLPYWTK